MYGYFGALVLAALAGAADPEAARETPRWHLQVAEEDDRRVGRQISAAIIERDWLAGALLADRLDGTHFVPGYQALLYQMVGRSDLVGRMEERGELAARAPCREAGDPRPALTTILERAEGRRVVIINDSHNHAHSRVLLYQLLAPLKAMGFDYLAVEDFSGSPADYGDLAYPGQAAAWQSSREPVFADAVRHAISLDYTLVPYEAEDEAYLSVAEAERLQFREDRQAQNLIERVLNADPHARVLVYAGHQHAYEAIVEPIGPTYKPMALRLRELSGIDPLTIDQTGCWAGHPGPVPGPIGFDAAGQAVTAGNAAGRVDLQIQQSRPESHARPAWLLSLGRVPVAVPDTLREGLEPVVVEARLASEPESAVPLDRLYLARGEHLPLYLRPGTYLVRAQSQTGWSRPMELTVE